MWLWAAVPGVVSFGIFYLSWVKFSVSLPLLLLIPIMFAMCFGVWSLLAFLFRRRLRRSIWNQLAQLAMRTCLDCGYDLTGNTSGVCPECGGKAEGKMKALLPEPHRSAPHPLVRAVAAFVIATGLCLCIFFAAGFLIWGVDTNTRGAQDTYAVVCIGVGVVVGYLVARRTYVATRRTFRPCAMRFCHQCGHDLTGNASGACPECESELGSPSHY